MKREPLCKSCRLSSMCKLTPLSSRYCGLYEQRLRDRAVNGVRVAEHGWEATK